MTETEKKRPTALAPLADRPPLASDPRSGGRNSGKPIAQANIQLELPEFHPPMILAAVFSQNSKCRQKGAFSREMTYVFGFYGPKIGGGSSYPKFVQKYQKL